MSANFTSNPPPTTHPPSHHPTPTAVAPEDFSSSSYELTFTPDNAHQDLCVIINIADDAIYEQTEQFMVYLTTNDSCVEFKQESTPISILDDDCELCSAACVCSSYNGFRIDIVIHL